MWMLQSPGKITPLDAFHRSLPTQSERIRVARSNWNKGGKTSPIPSRLNTFNHSLSAAGWSTGNILKPPKKPTACGKRPRLLDAFRNKNLNTGTCYVCGCHWNWIWLDIESGSLPFILLTHHLGLPSTSSCSKQCRRHWNTHVTCV